MFLRYLSNSSAACRSLRHGERRFPIIMTARNSSSFWIRNGIRCSHRRVRRSEPSRLGPSLGGVNPGALLLDRSPEFRARIEAISSHKLQGHADHGLGPALGVCDEAGVKLDLLIDRCKPVPEMPEEPLEFPRVGLFEAEDRLFEQDVEPVEDRVRGDEHRRRRPGVGFENLLQGFAGDDDTVGLQPGEFCFRQPLLKAELPPSQGSRGRSLRCRALGEVAHASAEDQDGKSADVFLHGVSLPAGFVKAFRKAPISLPLRDIRDPAKVWIMAQTASLDKARALRLPR
jgi:hypothetical protein